MADTGEYKLSFGPPPELMFPEFAKLTDAGEALLTGAGVENWLEHLLITHMRPLSNRRAEDIFSGHGPLSSFYSKIIMAHAFYLIDDETRATLLIIKEVRNAFAHPKERIHFESPEIIKVCNKFRGGKDGSENKLLFQNRAKSCVAKMKTKVAEMKIKIDTEQLVRSLTESETPAGTKD